MTLLIMAAGMGSRYGGIKQIESVGANGELIIDYSIYDAIKAGFNRVVFVIRRDIEKDFCEAIFNRIKDRINAEYVFQDISDLPAGYTVPDGRKRPWGTAHAILAARDVISEPFCVINADDFYGRESYEVVSEFFKQKEENEYLVVGYKVSNTLTEHGSTKRGICIVKDGYLEDLLESVVDQNEGVVTASPLDGRPQFTIDKDTPVAMNMFGFTDEIYEYIEEDFRKFFEKNKEDLSKCERLIPDIVGDTAKNNIKRVKVEPTTAVWQGITYKEDKQKLVDEIATLINNNEYPESL